MMRAIHWLVWTDGKSLVARCGVRRVRRATNGEEEWSKYGQERCRRCVLLRKMDAEKAGMMRCQYCNDTGLVFVIGGLPGPRRAPRHCCCETGQAQRRKVVAIGQQIPHKTFDPATETLWADPKELSDASWKSTCPECGLPFNDWFLTWHPLLGPTRYCYPCSISKGKIIYDPTDIEREDDYEKEEA